MTTKSKSKGTYKRRSKFVTGTPDIVKLEGIADMLADKELLASALEVRRAAAWIRERL